MFSEEQDGVGIFQIKIYTMAEKCNFSFLNAKTTHLATLSRKSDNFFYSLGYFR